MKRRKILAVAALLAGGVMPLSAVVTWNASSDFLANESPDLPNPASTELSNPNAQFPAWKYGYRDEVVSSTLNLFGPSDHTNEINDNPDFQGWKKDFLIIGTNTNSVTSGGLAPGELLVHPMGTSSLFTFAVIRWTAPATGIYDISASWYALGTDTGANGVDSHIVLNGSSLRDIQIAPGQTATDYRTLSLSAGDALDFVLGPGSAGTNTHDSTIVNATITLVPEPSAALLAVLSIPVLFLRRRGMSPCGWTQV